MFHVFFVGMVLVRFVVRSKDFANSDGVRMPGAAGRRVDSIVN